MGGWRVLIAVVASLGALAPAVWLWSRCAAAPPSGPPSANPAPRLDPSTAEQELGVLREALAVERRQRIALADEVGRLHERLEASAAAAGTPAAVPIFPELAEAGIHDEAPAERPTSSQPWFDAAALAAHGAPPDEIERLNDIFSESEMDRIELAHRARREGWHRKKRYFNEIEAQQSRLREDLGDETYDLLLFASGRTNRVVLSDVLGDSPAASAGLQPGDMILSYDGERIFKRRDLLRATTQGEIGDSVPVDVLRAGHLVRLYTARGALGARLRSARLLPETRW